MKSSLHRFVAVLFLMALLVTSCAQPKPTASPPPTAPSAATAPTAAEKVGAPYKIGFLAAITGGNAFLGVPERDAALMLQKEFDAQGGIVGPDGVRHPVQILIHDTESKGDVAITVAKKLINDEKVIALVGPTGSPVAMALIPVVQEAGVPLVTMVSSHATVTPIAERKWIFKVAASNIH
ncbi:MAG: ABC transporter substrate-binding protein, partial [Chloroflexi bacterium]|nr:ABC transporter substrate-binding protein [Chloroflexota bacterium]